MKSHVEIHYKFMQKTSTDDVIYNKIPKKKNRKDVVHLGFNQKIYIQTRSVLELFVLRNSHATISQEKKGNSLKLFPHIYFVSNFCGQIQSKNFYSSGVFPRIVFYAVK